MRTCAICNKRSTDETPLCPKCGADLNRDSVTARALDAYKNNPRVRDIRLMVPDRACPVCLEAEGTYTKESAPSLPIEGCSCVNGCEAHYEPMLTEIYP
jgi:RNA polymerase subunit RPABC4/transcription elongation factor Spt4